MIELKNVSKSYGSFQAVKDINFCAQPGKILGLLGPNGAGKTTLMKIITGYHNAQQGSATVCGINVSDNSVEAKKHIGYLPETNPLYDDLLVYEYLQFIAQSRGISSEGIAHAIGKVINSCGLQDFVYKMISNLSKGMRQRVGLAQAIIHNPDVVILDEPTSGLDPNQIKEIRTVISELGKTKTIILSTHILQEVEALCSHIIIVNKGSIVAQGTSEEIEAKLKGDASFSLTLVGTVNDGALLKLKSLPSVRDVKVEVKSNGNTDMYVFSEKSKNLQGEQIFDWAVQNTVRIRKIFEDTTSLESLFAEITRSDLEESEDKITYKESSND